MDFWDWINKTEDRNTTRFWRLKENFRYFVGVVVIFVVPILIYFLIKWDPVIGIDEEGEPVTFGSLMVVCLYWFGLYISYKRHEAKTRLNQLLDKLLNDEEADYLFREAERMREILKKENPPFFPEKGENRVRYFGID